MSPVARRLAHKRRATVCTERGHERGAPGISRFSPLRPVGMSVCLRARPTPPSVRVVGGYAPVIVYVGMYASRPSAEPPHCGRWLPEACVTQSKTASPHSPRKRICVAVDVGCLPQGP